MSNQKLAAVYVNAAAALATALAQDLQDGKLWPGDYGRKVTEIYENLRRADGQIREDR